MNWFRLCRNATRDTISRIASDTTADASSSPWSGPCTARRSPPPAAAADAPRAHMANAVAAPRPPAEGIHFDMIIGGVVLLHRSILIRIVGIFQHHAVEKKRNSSLPSLSFAARQQDRREPNERMGERRTDDCTCSSYASLTVSLFVWSKSLSVESGRAQISL